MDEIEIRNIHNGKSAIKKELAIKKLLPKSAKADKDKEEKPADSDQGGKPAAKASTETPLRSDAGVRPHDVDDRKVSLEDRLRDGFMAAYRNRVGEDSPEHSQINA